MFSFTLSLMRNIASIALAASLLAACSSTHTVKEPTLSGLELQQLQSREYEAPLKVVFASVLSVFQDNGYIVESADTETGFITAKSPSASKTTYDLFWGLGKKHQATMVTGFVEPVGQSFSRVRLNFVAIKENSRTYGVTSRVDTPIEDPDIYANAFEKIDETIFIRISTQ